MTERMNKRNHILSQPLSQMSLKPHPGMTGMWSLSFQGAVQTEEWAEVPRAARFLSHKPWGRSSRSPSVKWDHNMPWGCCKERGADSARGWEGCWLGGGIKKEGKPQLPPASRAGPRLSSRPAETRLPLPCRLYQRVSRLQHGNPAGPSHPASGGFLAAAPLISNC